MALLTHPMRDLELYKAREKLCTIRNARPIFEKMKAGDSITLQFGARHKPTTVRGVIEKTVKLDTAKLLAMVLEGCFDPEFETYEFSIIELEYLNTIKECLTGSVGKDNFEDAWYGIIEQGLSDQQTDFWCVFIRLNES
jgi:hypothetical protein